MKIAVIGKNGMLGHDLCRQVEARGHELIAYGREDLDVTNIDSVRTRLGADKPHLVINPAAFHGAVCETNPGDSYAVNAGGAANVALVTNELGCKVMFMSTDYVFGGHIRVPYTELAKPDPINIYGHSKVVGENVVRTLNPQHYIVRAGWLYGVKGSKKGHTFPTMAISLAQKPEAEKPSVEFPDDQFGTPTSTWELAGQMVVIGETDEYGIFHASNEGQASWYGFAKLVFELTGQTKPLNPRQTTPEEARTRPLYTVLENARLKNLDLNQMSPWETAVEAYLKEKELI